MPRKRKSYVVTTKTLEKEIIEIDSDEDVVGQRMLAGNVLCGEVKQFMAIESGEQLKNAAVYGETSRSSMQIVCADDGASGLDSDYKKYLEGFMKNEDPDLVEHNDRDSTSKLLRHNVVHNEGYNRATCRVVKKQPRIKQKPISRTVFRLKDSQEKKGDLRRRSKIPVIINNADLKPTSYAKDNLLYSFKGCKENVESTAGRNAKSHTFFSASKRLKTGTGRVNSNLISKTPSLVKTKDTLRKGEALRGRINVKSKSTSYAKDNSRKFKARKKNGERAVELDESYAYEMAYLNKSRTSFGSEQLMKRKKDPVCFSNCDIIAISNHPFSDGDMTPFEANKDHRVIDVEDGIGTGLIFNSSFSKKLAQILRQPYNKKEYMELYRVASLHKQMSRTRELRCGRDITYKISQLAPSYLDQYPDFKKKFHCYKKDPSIALNLLRGFVYYLQNVVHEGAFKPWLHEECFVTYMV